jgi:hypothetical protein
MDTDSLTNHANDEAVPDLSLNAVFDVLADSHRRFALSYLYDCSTPIAIADLILETAASQYGTTKDEVPKGIVKQETTRFHHCHLPKLVDARLVSVNADRNTVETTEALESVEQFLTTEAEQE